MSLRLVADIGGTNARLALCQTGVEGWLGQKIGEYGLGKHRRGD
jgi:glucokinase